MRLKSAKCGNFSLLQFLSECRDDVDENTQTYSISNEFMTVLDDVGDVEIDERELASIIFIAGYIAHKLVRNIVCSLCKYELCPLKPISN